MEPQTVPALNPHNMPPLGPWYKFFLYQVARYVAFHDGPRIPSEFLRVLISRVPLSPSEFLRASPLRGSIRLIPLVPHVSLGTGQGGSSVVILTMVGRRPPALPAQGTTEGVGIIVPEEVRL